MHALTPHPLLRRLERLALFGALTLLFCLSCDAPVEPLCERDPEACEPPVEEPQRQLGEACDTGRCPEASLCLEVIQGESPICLATCQQIGEACEQGGSCIGTTSSEQGVCYGGTTALGEPCQGDVDCAAGLSCVSLAVGAPSVCVRACEQPGSLCEDGALCLGDATASACLPGGELAEGEPCEQSASCALGLRCVSLGDEERLCVRACEQPTSCRPGARCEPLQSTPGSVCRPHVGAACTSEMECPTGSVCSTSLEDTFFFANLWPLGACTEERGCEQGGCLPGSSCRPLMQGAAVCAPSCESDADCRFGQGWRCLDRSACEADQAGCVAYFGEEKLCLRPDRVWAL